MLSVAVAGLRPELSRWNKVLSLDASSSDKTGVPSADLLTPEEERRKQLSKLKRFYEEGGMEFLMSSHKTAKLSTQPKGNLLSVIRWFGTCL